MCVWRGRNGCAGRLQVHYTLLESQVHKLQARLDASSGAVAELKLENDELRAQVGCPHVYLRTGRHTAALLHAHAGLVVVLGVAVAVVLVHCPNLFFILWSAVLTASRCLCLPCRRVPLHCSFPTHPPHRIEIASLLHIKMRRNSTKKRGGSFTMR